MKTIILVIALLFSHYSDAKDFSIENEGGGNITFTDVKGSCEDGKLMAYATLKGGRVALSGCWFYVPENEKLFVIWSDGEVYEYQ